MAALLLTLLVLAAAATLWWRRRLPGPAAPALRVVARAPLGARAGLALVEVAGRQVLVGYGDGVTVLTRSPLPGDAPARPLPEVRA